MSSVSPFVGAGTGGGSPTVPNAPTPPPLFEDEIAKKKAAEYEKARAEMERAQAAFGLKGQALTEFGLREKIDEIKRLERFSPTETTASLIARKDALGLLGQLVGGNAGKLDVASMTKVGQLAGGGRVFVNATESPVVQEAKKLLGVQTASKTILEQIRDKKGATLNAKR